MYSIHTFIHTYRCKGLTAHTRELIDKYCVNLPRETLSFSR